MSFRIFQLHAEMKKKKRKTHKQQIRLGRLLCLPLHSRLSDRIHCMDDKPFFTYP